VIAGGTDVLIKIREGKLAGCSLVSIHELGEELSGVTLADNGDVEIGPLTTFRGVTFSDVIRRTIPVLGEAADMAGGPQLRAAGTIGGNVCNGITSAHCFLRGFVKNETKKEGIPDHNPGSHRNHKGKQTKKGCLHRQPYG